MTESIGATPRLVFSAGREEPDPLYAIARRLFPLVRRRSDWWRDAVRRWARNPPRHYIERFPGPPSINTKELRTNLRKFTQERGKRAKSESTKDWAKREAAIARHRARASQLLVKLKEMEDGDLIYDDCDSLILPIPFPDSTTTHDERLALLAAIHDTYATADVRIDPWPEPLKCSKADAMANNAWRVLCDDRVPRLREHWDTHQAAIDRFAADAEQHVEKSLGSLFMQIEAQRDIVIGMDGGANDRGEPRLPIVRINAQAASIEWPPGGKQYQVPHAWAETFQKLIDAKGLPVGIGCGKPLRKPADDLVALKAAAPELAAIIAKGKGNSGYRLTIFD